MGSRGLQPCQQGRFEMCVCVQWQLDARGAGLYPPVPGRIQNRPQVDARPQLPAFGWYGYMMLVYRLTDDGGCPECTMQLPGIWGKRGEVLLGGPEGLRRRMPRTLQRMRSDIPTP